MSSNNKGYTSDEQRLINDRNKELAKKITNFYKSRYGKNGITINFRKGI